MELTARVETLEAALEAERALRTTEHATHQRLEAAARDAFAGRDALMQAATEARKDEGRVRLAHAAAADEVARLRAEIGLRSAYTAEVEGMLQTHADMQTMLTESLHSAQAAQEQADAQRRLSDENLRILRDEFERATRGAG